MTKLAVTTFAFVGLVSSALLCGCSGASPTDTGSSTSSNCPDTDSESGSGSGDRTSVDETRAPRGIPTPPGGPAGGGIRPQTTPCGRTSSGSARSGSSASSGSADTPKTGSGDSDESYGFCFDNQGWSCPSSAAKSACIKGNCGPCKKDPSQCTSDDGSDDDS